MLYGLLCGLGVEGGLMLGLTLAEVITDYWNYRNRTSRGERRPSPQKVYFFNRRVHHGQIGALLLLSLFFRGTSVPAAILTGIGIGLIKDDYADLKDWFRFKKEGENRNRKYSKSEQEHDNDHYSGNHEDINILASNKPPYSVELRRQRRRTYYRFKRWQNSTH